MIDLAIAALILLGLLLFVFPLIRWIFRRDRLDINGKLIWVDKGKSTKPFFNKKFEVLGKPDLMYKIKGGILAVEYKSRKGNIFLSDIIQAKTAALAARDSYKVTRILVKTATTQKYFDLPGDKALFNEIKDYVCAVRNSRKGKKMKALPNKFKCRSCAYANDCRYKK